MCVLVMRKNSRDVSLYYLYAEISKKGKYCKADENEQRGRAMSV